MLANLAFVQKACCQCSGGNHAVEVQTGQDDKVLQLQPALLAGAAGVFCNGVSALPCHGSLCKTRTTKGGSTI